MKKQSLLNDYLRIYAANEKWHLVANDSKNISSVIVVPVYAEKESIFSTLVSVARNPASYLEDTLVICVVNNRSNSCRTDIKNNQDTISILEDLVSKKSLEKYVSEKNIYRKLTTIADTKVKLGYIDASSIGFELPDKDGGVGMARKIGMDAALRLWQNDFCNSKLIFSLDADTLVQENYLFSVKNYFTKQVKTAIVSYEHQIPPQEKEKAAICCYENFLRYWVLGLKYANSPYAYHSIGSTIITTAQAYLEVRGMNKRQAGEDFYFLNKLAKVGKIHYIKKTCVYPSSRSSVRVPFGTGKKVHSFLSGNLSECLVYDPYIFSVLVRWLELMENNVNLTGRDILNESEKIHSLLKVFLQDYNFINIWSKIRNNTKEQRKLVKQFHDWFDAFKTFKLINHFTRQAYKKINILDALNRINSIFGRNDLSIPLTGDLSQPKKQMQILEYLRKIT